MVKGKPKRDSSGRGVGLNIGRGGCATPQGTRKGVTRVIQHKRRTNKCRVTVKKHSREVPLSTQKQIITNNYSEIRNELKRQGKVRIPDIGILRINTKPARKSRMGRNPFTGEQMMFKAKPKSKVVKFRSAKSLKDLIS